MTMPAYIAIPTTLSLFADTLYSVSSATDHFREQAKHGGFALARCQDFGNFTSALPHYPSTTFRLKNNDKVPSFINREFRPPQSNAAELCTNSTKGAVSGSHRYKYGLHPPLASHMPIIFIKAPQHLCLPLSAVHNSDQLLESSNMIPAAVTVATQSDYRESEAQTNPYSPAVAISTQLTNKAAQHAALQHCGGTTEVSHLTELSYELGQVPGADDVEKIKKLRAKRAFEASLPPLSNPDSLPLRQKMMEARELQEWAEREGEIQHTQNERFGLLQQAILAREAEVEMGNADRVSATTDRLLSGKQAAFAALQKRRVKAIRHFMDCRKYVT
jgi:hypothetical protein